MSTQFVFWFLQGPGWLLVIYLVATQCVSAFSYEFGVRIGAQERIGVVVIGKISSPAFGPAAKDLPRRQRPTQADPGLGRLDLHGKRRVAGAGRGQQ